MIKRVAVFGNPSINDEGAVITEFLKDHGIEDPIVIVHGGAKGPSAHLAHFADSVTAWATIKFAPWTMYLNRLADLLKMPNGGFNPVVFYLRNKQCLDNCDYAYIFVNDSPCSETDKMIEQCEKRGIAFKVVEVI